MERTRADYANFLRSTLRSFSQLHAGAAENLLIARYLDRVIARACAAPMDQVIKELNGK